MDFLGQGKGIFSLSKMQDPKSWGIITPIYVIVPFKLYVIPWK